MFGTEAHEPYQDSSGSERACLIEGTVLKQWYGCCSNLIDSEQAKDDCTGEVILEHFLEDTEPPREYSAFFRPQDITVPDGITAIAARAFEEKNMRSVLIPEGVEEIGDYAFLDCPYLEKVSLPASLQRIGVCAFTGCKRLREINLPESVQVKEGAFLGCSKLMDEEGYLIQNRCLYAYTPFESIQSLIIPDGVEYIAPYAFAGKWTQNVRSLQLPKSLRDPDTAQFYGFYGLADQDGFVVVRGVLHDYCGTSAVVHVPETVHTISEEALWHCGFFLKSERGDHLREIILPSSLSRVNFSAISPDDSELIIHVPSTIEETQLFFMIDTLSYPDEPFQTLIAAPHVPPQGRFAENLALGLAAAFRRGYITDADIPRAYQDYYASHPDLLNIES